MKRLLPLAIPLLLLAACATSNGGPDERVTIESVVDAITFRTTDGDLVRLMGIRTPAAAATVECYGKEALEAAESLVGKELRLEKEPLLERAQDGAYPRYVWLTVEKPQQEQEQTGTGATASGTTANEEANETKEETEEILVNERALELGTAFPLVAQEMLYGERMLAAARYASATQKGLWGACEVQSQQTPQGTWLGTQPLTECIVKGKVTKDGRKLYRTPECSAYAETTVLLQDGGQWFCAADTAEDAGFEKASDC